MDIISMKWFISFELQRNIKTNETKHDNYKYNS